MNIILINPPYFGIEDDHLEQNLGIAYIASYLIHHGFHNTDILELTGISDLNECLKKIPYADAYGISCYTTSYDNVRFIISFIKNKINPEAYIFVGGPHPTALPKQTFVDSGANLVITGEGENAALIAMQSLKDGNPIKGVVHGKGIANLDSLPYPIRLISKDNPFTRVYQGERMVSMVATRGCPFSCLHCNSNIMGAGSKGIRSRSVENIIGEIRYLKQLGYHCFRFNDDNFLAHSNIVELLDEISKEKIKFRIFGHVEYLTDYICRLLKLAGCEFVSVGIESLNPDNLKFLHKYSNIMFLHNLQNAQRYGLVIRASFMVGLPFDTDDTIKLYFSEAVKLYIQEFAVYPLIPYPGTEIAINAEKLHYKIVNNDYNNYMQMGVDGEACYSLSYNNPETGNSFGPEDVKRWKQKAEELLSTTMIHMRNSVQAK